MSPEEVVAEAVSRAPSLTDEQAEALAAILRGVEAASD